jgi:hypothetical protein
MKNRIACYCLCTLVLATSAFSMDEYMPVETGKMEIDMAFLAVYPTGVYDSDGEKQEFTADIDPMASLFGLQLKYGLVPNLDLEASWIFENDNDDMGGTSGFQQPELGFKYAVVPGTFAVFGNLIFPFVTGDFDTDPLLFSMGVEPGIVFNATSGQFQLLGKASYTHYFENADEYKDGNVVNVFLKPGVAVDPKFSVYLGAEYLLSMESEGGGTGLGDDGYLLALAPGFTFTPNSSVAFEANVPFTVAGENAFSFWGFSLMAYFTVGP